MIEWIQANWVGLVACLYALESILSFVAKFTPWKFDDNLSGWLGSFLARFFPKAQ